MSSTNLAIVDLAQRIPVGTPPQPIGPTQERGVYIFFDAPNWRRVRREFSLEHEELDNRDHSPAVANGSAGGGGFGAASMMAWGANGAASGSGGMGFGGPVQAPASTGAVGGLVGGFGGSGAIGGQQQQNATAAGTGN